MKTLEVLVTDRTSGKGRVMLQAMSDAAGQHGYKVRTTPHYEGRSNTLMLYGYGEIERHAACDAQVRRGGRVIVWDLGYWDRDTIPRAYRLSIDGPHPPQFVREAPDSGRDHPPVVSIGDAKGFGLLCGTPPKSAKLHHHSAEWERQKWAQLQKLYPGNVRYRQKPGRPCLLPGVETVPGEIDDVMRGAALMVTRFSNTGLDAIRCGVSAVVEGGIAAAFWPKEMVRVERTEAEREAFLRRVAWFQWKPHEASQCWAFIRGLK